MKQNGGPTLSMRMANQQPPLAHTLPMTHRSQYGGLSKGRFGARSAAGGSFAPSLSSSSFFTRHNPHPSRVRHMKGLLDVPICHVSDDGFQPSQRPLMTPERRSIYQAYKIPSTVSQYPIFPTNSYGIDTYDVFHTKGVPYRKVPMLPRWFEELKEISNRAGLEPGLALEQQQTSAPKATYSKVTGRLNEAPSRAMSRSGPASRSGRLNSRSGMFTGGINKQPDNEALVMELLSQILQTDSISAIQQWLTCATEREKDIVSDMIRAALVADQQATDINMPGKDDFLENKHQQNDHFDRLVVDQPENSYQAQNFEQFNPATKLPDINQPNSSRLYDGALGNNARFDYLAPVAENDQEYVEYRSIDNPGMENGDC